MIETWPEIMLMIDAGTKNGEIRRGPRFSSIGLGVFDQRQAADARADQAADALRFLLAELVVGGKAGVLDRLDRRRRGRSG